MRDKGRFPHFMIKEIFEQPQAVRDTITDNLSPKTGRVELAVTRRIPRDASSTFKKITIAASGTSRHAGIAGSYMIEELSGIPVDVEYASEFEYGNPITGPEYLTIVITQSGETADTLGAQRLAQTRGSRVLAITNVLDSTIAREADAVIHTQAGPEISIASTKAFGAQLVALYLLAVYLGETRGTLSDEKVSQVVKELLALPDRIEKVLAQNDLCEQLAKRYYKMDDFLYIGRNVHYPIALDGALKLKETSYIHAEGYPAGEIKHGPYALIDEQVPVVGIATRDLSDPQSVLRAERTINNLREVKETGGRVIAVATEGDSEVADVAHHVITVPKAPELLSPILEIVPLQMLAYHIAVHRGVDVDRPRNLVKSVTME